jgi:two-component system, LytTR family, sensor histidine kinase AgrC
MWYWTLLEQAANLVEAIMLIVLLQQFFECKYKIAWVNAASSLAIFAMINLLNILNSPIPLNMFLYFAVGILISFLFFKGSIASHILVPLLMVALVLIPELLTMGLLQIVFSVHNDQFMQDTSYRMLGIIISKVMLIALVYIAGRFTKKANSSIPLLYSLSLMLVPMISITCVITIMQYMLYTDDTALNPLWLTFSALGLLFINLLIIFLFDAFMKYSRNQNQYQLMIQQTDMLSNHLRETNALQEETHRVWHDMKNHFTVIQWMVKSKSYDKLDQYMLTLNETVTDSMLKIQSGNPILDALLNPKAAEAKKHCIDLSVNTCIPSDISIEDIDLNIVISNALDNAIEACKKLPEGQEKFIDIDSYIKNDHLLLVMKNSFNGIIKKVGDELKTTKDDPGRHGIGMGNMKRVVDKYDGHIMTNIDGNVFILSVVMYCRINCRAAG